jgi:hypothetical protein
VVGALGGLALVVGIVLVALRDENSPATPTTVVTTLPVTSVPSPTVSPVTTVAPVSSPTPTTSGR